MTRALSALIACLTCLQLSAKANDCRNYQHNDSINAELLLTDLRVLSSDDFQGRKTQTAGAKLARDYIAQQLALYQVAPLPNQTDYLLPFHYKKGLTSVEGVNVAAMVAGTAFSNKYIIVTAHYDHLGKKGAKVFNGADDNASGVAALLALARYTAKKPLKHSVIFLATDAEEKGLFGAKGFVQTPPVALEDMRFNLNLDMLSQNKGRNRLYISGARYYPELAPVVDKSKEQAGLCLVDGHRSQQRGSIYASRNNWRQASDHAAFARVGIPYLFIGVTDHPYYHTVNDTYERINPDFYRAAAETSLTVLLNMDAMSP